MADSDDDEVPSNNFQLTSILFGNIDESGQLEEDILDSVSKRHLASLARLGLSSIINELLDDAEFSARENNINNDELEEENSGQNFDNYDAKSPSAVDYSDINELAEDIFVNSNGFEAVKNEEDTTDYDADDEGPTKRDVQLMPPPPLPGSEYGNTTSNDDIKQKKLETPLAAMLPSKYQNVDVKELFPDFRHDKVSYYQFIT